MHSHAGAWERGSKAVGGDGIEFLVILFCYYFSYLKEYWKNYDRRCFSLFISRDI
jgi:hypothetical protein